MTSGGIKKDCRVKVRQRIKATLTKPLEKWGNIKRKAPEEETKNTTPACLGWSTNRKGNSEGR